METDRDNRPWRACFRWAYKTLASAVLTWFYGPWWLLLTGFVGLNMMQASVTGFCPVAFILRALGLKPGAAFQ